MYSSRIVTRFRTFLMLAAAFLAAANPCLAALSIQGVCPMAGCADPDRTIGSADCCCVPGGTTAQITSMSAVTAPASAEGLVADQGPRSGVPIRLAGGAGPRLPETVPLFLKHATLLI
jgi:hypothetical protein